MKPFLYFETGSTDPYYNLAFEEAVFELCTDKPVLILWQNDNTVVIGKNQIAEQQFDRDYAEEHDVRVVRRMTGGGAVYHDLGNLNYSFITDAERGTDRESLKELTEPVVRALRKLGLEAGFSGRNDILVGGRKVSGTAQRLANHRILHHGTLLFDSDADAVQAVLSVDPEKFRGKGVRSVRSRIGNIRDHLASDMDLPRFWNYLKGELLSEGAKAAVPDSAVLERAEQLAAGKYRTFEWNYGQSPRYERSGRNRFPGGTLECTVSVDQGRIRAVRFYGDFLAMRPLDGIERSLEGVPMEEAAVSARLKEFSLPEFFGELTEEQIVCTLLNKQTTVNNK